MAGRAAHRATLAARPAQAVSPSPASASSPRQRHGTPCERRAPFEALPFARPVSCSRFDLQKARRYICRDRVARWVEIRLDDDCLGGAPSAEPPSVLDLAADQDLFGQWQAVVTFGRIGRHGQARRHAFEDEAGLSRFVRRALLTAQKRHAQDRRQLRSGGSFTFGIPLLRNSVSLFGCHQRRAWEDGLRAASCNIAGVPDR